MKFKFGELVIWFFLAYVLFWLRDMARDPDFLDSFDWLWDFKSFITVITNLISFFSYSLLTYAALFFFYQKGQQLYAILGLALMIPVGVYFRYILQEIVQQGLLGFGNYTDNYTLHAYFLDNLYYTIYYPWVGGIFYFVQSSRFREKQQKELELQNQASQLSLLRSQVNPHFLFNALNNIYSLVYHKSDHSLNAVEKLSGLLRYSLYEQEEKVSLNKEIRYLEDFISLERMRHDYDIPIQFDIELDPNKIQVIPFLLIPFVENAFKHGELKSTVEIKLFQTDKELLFQTRNRMAQKEKDNVGGIGLDNLKKRLALYYGSSHQLIIRPDEKHFLAELKIDLNQC